MHRKDMEIKIKFKLNVFWATFSKETSVIFSKLLWTYLAGITDCEMIPALIKRWFIWIKYKENVNGDRLLD